MTERRALFIALAAALAGFLIGHGMTDSEGVRKSQRELYLTIASTGYTCHIAGKTEEDCLKDINEILDRNQH